jgi:hypothetical protein
VRGAQLGLIAVLMTGCSGQPNTPASGPAGPSYAPLRACATVTSQCPGVAAIARAAPSLCTSTDAGVVCADSRQTRFVGNSSRRADVNYTEQMVAMDTAKGTCALNAIYRERGGSFAPGEFAVLGIWGVQNGVYQYREAQFLRNTGEVKTVSEPKSFAAACQRLATIIS